MPIASEVSHSSDHAADRDPIASSHHRIGGDDDDDDDAHAQARLEARRKRTARGHIVAASRSILLTSAATGGPQRSVRRAALDKRGHAVKPDEDRACPR